MMLLEQMAEPSITTSHSLDTVAVGKPQRVTATLDNVWVAVTVHNAAHVVRACIQSLHHHTPAPVSFVIVDDASNGYTAAMLDGLCQIMRAAGRHVDLIRHVENQKYTRSINEAFAHAFSSGATWCVALNSDTLLTPQWIERIIHAGSTDDTIGIASPLMSDAANLTLKMAPGASYALTADRLATRKATYPDAVTPVGACMAVKAECWAKHGPFDESVSPEGYGEECHFWAHATANGWRSIIVDDCFVYHESHASFGKEANEKERTAVEKFMHAHGPRYFAAKSKAVNVLPRATEHVQRARVDSDRINICFFINSIQLCGGILSLVNICNQLIERGVNATIAFQRDIFGDWKLMPSHFGPVILDDPRSWRSAGGFERGIIVATAWHTGEFVHSLCSGNRGLLGAAFIQDREDMFRRPEGTLEYDHPSKFAAYLDIVRLGRNVVNSNWVRESMRAEHEITAPMRYVPIGVDPDVFYPRGARTHSPVRILTFSRPSTPRRGYALFSEVYRRIHARYGNAVELYTYDQAPGAEVPAKHLGKLPQTKLAEIMAGNDILIEPSYVQGWGMPAQEMMATGGAVVSTDNGGIHNYGVDGENCLIVPATVEGIFDGTCRLIEDKALCDRLGSAGRETALRLSWSRIADVWLEVIREWATHLKT